MKSRRRYNRALSRYVQAVIKVETGEEALEGLERVQRKMGDAQPLSVDTIGPLIAGKTYNYAAATRYRPKPGEETNRVSLVEFFTNTHFKEPHKEEGAIGGALGNEGVMTYFPRRKVAMLTYHLTHPQLELDSLVNELAQDTASFLWCAAHRPTRQRNPVISRSRSSDVMRKRFSTRVATSSSPVSRRRAISNWNSPVPSKGIRSPAPSRSRTCPPVMPRRHRPRSRLFWLNAAFFTRARARSSSSAWWPAPR